ARKHSRPRNSTPLVRTMRSPGSRSSRLPKEIFHSFSNTPLAAVPIPSAAAGQLRIVEVLEKPIQDRLLGTRRPRQHAIHVHGDDAADELHEGDGELATFAPLAQLREQRGQVLGAAAEYGQAWRERRSPFSGPLEQGGQRGPFPPILVLDGMPSGPLEVELTG